MKRLVFTSIFLSSGLTLGAYTNATLNISACGGRMSGSGYTSIGSLVPIGGQTSQSGSLCNYSGFAAGFILQPKTAFSGLADEWNPDNDRDGLQDGEEITAGSSLYNSDTDGDGLSDPDELKTYGTSPILADSDRDGLGDKEEVTVYKTNPLKADTDGDGLNDSEELLADTNPLKKDTDGDGASDGLEIRKGFDPLDPKSTPRLAMPWLQLLLD